MSCLSLQVCTDSDSDTPANGLRPVWSGSGRGERELSVLEYVKKVTHRSTASRPAGRFISSSIGRPSAVRNKRPSESRARRATSRPRPATWGPPLQSCRGQGQVLYCTCSTWLVSPSPTNGPESGGIVSEGSLVRLGDFSVLLYP